MARGQGACRKNCGFMAYEAWLLPTSSCARRTSGSSTNALPVAGAQPGHAFLPVRGKNLDLIFSLQHERTVNQDNTVHLGPCVPGAIEVLVDQHRRHDPEQVRSVPGILTER